MVLKKFHDLTNSTNEKKKSKRCDLITFFYFCHLCRNENIRQPLPYMSVNELEQA